MDPTNDSSEEYFWRIKHQKKQKFSGTPKRKGRTLRAKNRNCQRQEVVSKFVTTSKQWDTKRINTYCENVTNDGGLVNRSEVNTRHCNNLAPANVRGFEGEVIQYSMNKQKRWTLATTLKKVMTGQVIEQDTEAPNIVIVHRSLPNFVGIRRCPDVTDVAFTSLCKTQNPAVDGRIVMSRSGSSKYSFTSDLLRRPQSKTQRRRESSGFETNENTDPNEQMPEVLYEFTHDCPKDSYPKDPYIESCKTNYYRKKMRRRHGFLDDYEEYKNGGFLSDADVDKHNSSNDYEITCNARESSNYDFTALLENSNKTRCQLVKKRRKHQKLSPESVEKNVRSVNTAQKKDRMLQVGDDFRITAAQEQKLCLQIERIINETKEEDCTMEIALDKEKLEKFIATYRNISYQVTPTDDSTHRITFSNTSPARFIAQFARLDLTFLTSLDEDVVDVGDDTDESQITNVLLKINGPDEILNQTVYKHLSELTKCDTVEDILYTVEKLCAKQGLPQLKRCVSLPKSTRVIESFNKRGVSDIVSDLSTTLGLIQHTYTSDEAMQQEFDSQIHSAQTVEGFLHVDDSTIKQCISCQSDGDRNSYSGFSLRGCRHWYCESCWRTHAIKKILQCEKESVHCMQVNCNERIDSAALKALLPSSIYQKYVQQVLKERKEFYHCSNNLCNLFTKVSTTGPSGNLNTIIPSLLICSCGASWCTYCGEKPHWPARCSTNVYYQAEIDISRGYLSHSIQGKSCPRCHIFTEKISGCNRVYCPCGCSYCYRCLNTNCSNQMDCCKAPFQTILVPIEINGLVVNPIKMRENGLASERHQDALFSKKNRAVVQTRAQAILKAIETYHSEEIEEVQTKAEDTENERKILENFLRIKDQIHFVIPLAQAEMRYGNKHSKDQHHIRNIVQKMELVSCNIEMILFKENDAIDLKLLSSCRTQIQSGRKLIRQLARCLHHK